jgi:hypothetical protein
LLFVAITRATKWCYISTPADQPLPLLQEKLVPLASIGQISTMDNSMNASVPLQNKPKVEPLDFL